MPRPSRAACLAAFAAALSPAAHPSRAAEPAGCASIPMSPAEAARVSVPSFKLSSSGAAFSSRLRMR